MGLFSFSFLDYIISLLVRVVKSFFEKSLRFSSSTRPGFSSLSRLAQAGKPH